VSSIPRRIETKEKEKESPNRCARTLGYTCGSPFSELTLSQNLRVETLTYEKIPHASAASQRKLLMQAKNEKPQE